MGQFWPIFAKKLRPFIWHSRLKNGLYCLGYGDFRRGSFNGGNSPSMTTSLQLFLAARKAILFLAPRYNNIAILSGDSLLLTPRSNIIFLAPQCDYYFYCRGIPTLFDASLLSTYYFLTLRSNILLLASRYNNYYF